LALLVAISALPLLVRPSWLPPRTEIYSAIPWRFGGHPGFQKTLFGQKGNLDIAFIGSSRVWCGVNSLYVQGKLSQSLGRDAEVATVGWNTAGFDALYFITEDLLQNRKVNMLVVDDEYNSEIGGSRPHRLASRWFRTADNGHDLNGLSLFAAVGYHASAALGMPRNLLGLVRRNRPIRVSPDNKFSPETLYRSQDPGNFLGALCVEENFDDLTGAFVRYQPATRISPDNVVVFSPTTRHSFGLSSRQLPDLQVHFARKLAALAKQNHAKLIFLHYPAIDEVSADAIREAAIWPEILDGDVAWVGIPPVTFFQGMTEPEARKLFSDPKHLNRNGQEYFTPLITEKLVELYHAEKNS